jgi:serine/threonine protein kinase
LSRSSWKEKTLRERLDRGAVPVREAIGIVLATARGIAAAHARGIVHRDLKPENVIQTEAGVKILDFGIAHVDSGTVAMTTLTGAGVMVGTPGYMAPEQLRGEPVDARTRHLCAGRSALQLLTGLTAVWPRRHAIRCRRRDRARAAAGRRAHARGSARRHSDRRDGAGEEPRGALSERRLRSSQR